MRQFLCYAVTSSGVSSATCFLSFGSGTSAVGTVTSSKELKFFPNPVASQITIQIPTDVQMSQADFVITDMSGKVVLSLQNEAIQAGTNHQLQMDTLSSGTYVITMKGKGEKFSAKFIKR